MASNYLEQLVAEWYEYQGYFILRNVMVGKLPKGGYEGELDIVAFHPETKHLIHIEPTHDAHSWAKREERFEKKFNAGRKYIPELIKHFNIPKEKEIEQICLLGFGSNVNHPYLAGGKVVTVSEFLSEVIKKIGKSSMHRNAMSENHPILRTLQFITQNRRLFSELLGNGF
ncbi:MAG: hypothetical protein SCARUB_04824 [Candidatus Scalindua rubra]|uniref:NERD domain-containing protein n=1 Tax=Candidatus Scalindua rubra TaxID=1872076 RepID=A0A1E3X369_9BACT|nr:MAG: hypothetical protein SCARUB_04824 [Candidatus Scalindua rubra]